MVRRMFHKGYGLLVFAWLVLGLGSPALAIPTLQLDIVGGGTFYDPVTETIVTSSPVFSLAALLNPDRDSLRDGDYFISAALVPKSSEDSNSGSGAGSFVFDGTTVDVPGDMEFGAPPFPEPADGKVLPGHGIFDTLFWQSPMFDFTNAAEIIPYNTQDNPGTVPVPAPGSGFYFQDFLIDVTNLSSDFTLHFDLYQTGSGIVEFAPFSHDGGFVDGQSVPEPGTLLLLGLGFVGLAGARRLRRPSGPRN